MTKDEEMIRKAFSELSPTDAQREKIWKMIETAEKKKTVRRFRLWRTLPAAVAGAALIFGTAFSIDAATGGNVRKTVLEIIGIDQGMQSVAGKIASETTAHNTVYAPEIQYIDTRYLVFGTQRGMLLYDRKKQQQIGSIDLQSIGAIYLSADTKKTKILVRRSKKEIIVFNEENGTAYGDYFIYSFTYRDDQELLLKEQGSDPDRLKRYASLKQEQEEDYLDSFSYFNKIGIGKEALHPNDWLEYGDYSEHALCWNAGKSVSYLLSVREGEYILGTYDKASGESSFEDIHITLSDKDSASAKTVPEFIYTGDDPVMAALCAYFQESTPGEIWIPSFIIYKQEKKGDEILVYGNFWSDGYLLNGYVLESPSGGERPARVHLKKTDDGYTVSSIDETGDGSEYAKGIKAFTKGHPGLYRKFFNWDKNEVLREASRKEFLQMYVRQSGLDIRYYKDSGWDPVPIFD